MEKKHWGGFCVRASKREADDTKGNGNPVFKNPDKALLQMQKESLDMLPKE